MLPLVSCQRHTHRYSFELRRGGEKNAIIGLGLHARCPKVIIFSLVSHFSRHENCHLFKKDTTWTSACCGTGGGGGRASCSQSRFKILISLLLFMNVSVQSAKLQNFKPCSAHKSASHELACSVDNLVLSSFSGEASSFSYSSTVDSLHHPTSL